MRIVDIMLAFPGILLAIVVVAILDPGLVMSPRPGRIVDRLEVNFSRAPGERDDMRAIKASLEFIAVREQILGLIWI
jgi:ABC-type taurine transport system ATPase subunit